MKEIVKTFLMAGLMIVSAFANASDVAILTGLPDGTHTRIVDGISWTFTVKDGKASLGTGGVYPFLAVPQSTSGEITIPSSFDGCPVTGIGENAFFRCGAITSLKIPETVTHIDDYAISYCQSLTSLKIPASVERIGEGALCENVSLTTLDIAEGVKQIGDFACSWGIKLQSVTIPSTVESVGEGAFKCSLLSTVTIRDGVKNIGASAFEFCDKLNSVETPSSLTNIAESAFECCLGLTSVVLANGVKSIGADAFFQCEELEEIQIPSSVTYIGEDAFAWCEKLATIYVEKGDADRVRGLLSASGFDVSLVEFVEIVREIKPDGEYTEKVGDYTWYFVVRGGKATVQNWKVRYDIAIEPTPSGDLTIPDTLGGCPVVTIGDYAFYNCFELTSVMIPDDVISIGRSAFADCRGLTSMTIPSGVTSIGGNAFSWCSGLTEVMIPDGVTSIEGWAFSSCSRLKSVTIPSGVTSIGEGAFYGCIGLTEATIPSGVTSIGGYAFEDCSGLTSVTISEGVTSIGNGAFYGCIGLTEMTIPSGVTSIGEGAFEGTPFYENQPDGMAIFGSVLYAYRGECPSSVTIPDGVTRIGDYAFRGCSGLASVTIPSSVTSIGDGVFYYCSALSSVVIPSSVTSIGDSVFYYCSALSSVVIPSSVTSIGDSAFERTPFYENQPDGMVIFGSVLYEYRGECPSSVTIPEGVTSIGDYAFEGCSGLASVTISEGVTSIGDGAFNSCIGLTEVTIPSSVTSIGWCVFWNCSGLKAIKIPSSVKSIGQEAFARCESMTTIYVEAGDGDRVKGLLEASGFDTSTVQFVEKAPADGVIYSVDLVGSGPYGGIIPTAEQPLMTGQKVVVRIRLVNRVNETTGAPMAWYFAPMDPLAQLPDLFPPQLGLMFGDRQVFADYLGGGQDGPRGQFTDLFFEYVVRSGDLALPARFMSVAGKAVNDHEVYDYAVRNGNFMGSYWGLVNDNGDDCLSEGGFHFVPDLMVPNPDPTWEAGEPHRWITGAGLSIYVKTVDFDNFYFEEPDTMAGSSGIWRLLYAGMTTATPNMPTVMVGGVATESAMMYVWVDDPNVANVLTSDNPEKIDGRWVIRVPIDAGISSASFRLQGISPGRTVVRMSSSPHFSYDKAGDIIEDWVERPIQVVEPPKMAWATLDRPDGCYAEGERARVKFFVDQASVKNNYVFLVPVNDDATNKFSSACFSTSQSARGCLIAAGSLESVQFADVEVLDGDAHGEYDVFVCTQLTYSEAKDAGYVAGRLVINATNVVPRVESVSIGGFDVYESGASIPEPIPQGVNKPFRIQVLEPSFHDLNGEGGEAFLVQWQFGDENDAWVDVYGNPYNPSNVVNYAFSLPGPHTVKVRVQDKDMRNLGKWSEEFSFTVMVSDPPSVSIDVGDAVWLETDIGRTVKVSLSEPCPVSLEIGIDVEAWGDGSLKLDNNRIVIPPGMVTKVVRVAELDGGFDSEFLLTAHVLTKEYFEYYQSSESFVRVRNVPPALIRPTETELDVVRTVIAGSVVDIPVAAVDVPADLNAGLDLTVKLNGVILPFTDSVISNSSVRVMRVLMNHVGVQNVNLRVEDKDGGSVICSMRYTVNPNTPPREDISSEVNQDGTLRLTQYTGEPVSHLEIPESIGGRRVTVIGSEFSHGTASFYSNMSGLAAESVAPMSIVTVPASVKCIEERAFGYCDGRKYGDVKRVQYESYVVNGIRFLGDVPVVENGYGMEWQREWDEDGEHIWNDTRHAPFSLYAKIFVKREYAANWAAFLAQFDMQIAGYIGEESDCNGVICHTINGATNGDWVWTYMITNREAVLSGWDLKSINMTHPDQDDGGAIYLAGGATHYPCITGKDGSRIAGRVYVPEEIDGYRVVGIGDSAFARLAIDAVVLSSGVERIGKTAFASCKELFSIQAPINIKEIGDYAFSSCSSLAYVSGLNSLERLGKGAFASCKSLFSASIQSNLREIPAMAFANCETLAELQIPNVRIIGPSAFAGCTSLKSISPLGLGAGGFPDNLSCIGEEAFAQCLKLETVLVPEGVTNIGTRAFTQCFELKNVEIESWNLSVEDFAFAECSALEAVTFVHDKSSCTIGEAAFSDCGSLKMIRLPGGLSRIGDCAFADCVALADVYFEGACPSTDSERGIYDGANKYLVSFVKSADSWGTLPGEWENRPVKLWNDYPNAVAHRVVVFDLRGIGERQGGGELIQRVTSESQIVEPVQLVAVHTTFAGWSPDYTEIHSALKFSARYVDDNGLEIADYYVRADGNDANNGFSRDTALRTIGKAIEKARDGSLILVGDGEYPAVVCRGDRKLLIRSENGSSRTIINGAGAGRCVLSVIGDDEWDIQGGARGLQMSGFAFVNGRVIDAWDGASGLGGGVYGGTYVDCVISNCTVSCEEEECGGAVAEASLFNCVIANNTVEARKVLAGGAVGCELTGCTIAGNTAPQVAYCSTNRCAISDESYEQPVLTVAPLSTSVYENAKSGTRVRMSRSGSLEAAMVVALTAPEAQLSIPLQVEIPAGSASTIFTVVPVDNHVVDGNRRVGITASALGCEIASCDIDIVDDEVPSLSLSLSADSLKEGGEKIVVTVTRDLVTDVPLTVYLTGITANRCSCPKSVTIPAGAASVTFEIEAASDDVARIAAEMTLRASAAGYESASKTFTVEDDDIPGVTLTLTPDAAQEGGSVRATVARVDEDDLSKAITVKLSASDPHEIASMPSSVTIPGGKVSVDFNVYLADDGFDNGDREIVFQGAILIESCGCSGQPSSGDAIEAELTIIDNDGPALSLSVSPATMREGLDEAGFLTISHNSVLDEDLTVCISYDLDSEIEVAEQVIIKAGQQSVTVPVKTLNDGVEDGSRLVTIAVEDAAGVFAPDTKWLMVTDQNLPDFSAEVDGSVSSVEAGGTFDCRLTIHNSGFADCGRAIPYAVYLLPESERDVTKGVLVSSGSIDGGLAQDALEVRTVTNVMAPSNVGHYRLGLVVDPNATITELDEANNTAWSNEIYVGPAYSARAYVALEHFERGAQVMISGSATQISGGKPATKVDVDVYIICDGIRTTLRAKTDAAGQFAVTYQPTSGVCGHCIVGACYPGEGLEDEQDTFDILGLKATSTSALVWDIALGDENTKTLSVRNPTGVDLTGFTIGNDNLPKGCELTLSAPAKLDAGDSQTFRITAKGTDLTDGVDYEPFEIVLTTAEGATLTHKAYFHCQSQKAYLRARPTLIDTTMTVGKVRTVEVEICNDGKGDSGPVSVNFKCPDWLRIIGGNIGNLASNESAVLTFELAPTLAHGLNYNAVYSGTVGINCENGTGLALPVKFVPVSEEFGSVKVDAIDDNTYHLEGKPHLANAVVKVTNPYTQKIVATGRTDENGLWMAADLPEGKYQLTVTANNHDTYADELLIEPGRTTSVTAFLQYQSIRVSWDVKPVEITDEYDVELTLVYETNVPQPTVLTHVDTGLANKKELPVLEEGGQHMFTITLENVGLIAAKRVTLTMPTIEGYTFALADNDVVVPAKSTVEIPVLFARPAKRKMLMANALKATVVKEEIVPCKPSMMTATYWDCDVERSYSYPTEFTHNSGMCKKVTYVTEPQPPTEYVPTRGGGSGGYGGGISGGTGTTWKKTSCEPCVNSIADAMVDCGLDESVAAMFQRQYDLLVAGRVVVPQGYSGVSMFGDGDQFVDLPKSVKSEAYDLSRLSNEVYNDKTQGYDIPEGFHYEPLEYDEVIKIIKSDGQFSCQEVEYRNFMWGKRPMTMIYSRVPTGFQASIFKDLDSGNLVLAFRGTEFEFSYNGIEDIVVDVDNAVCFQTSQYILARDLLSDILKARGEDVIVTGHSLGGGLTQYAMAKNSVVGRSVKGYTFNPAGQCMFKLFLVSESARKAAGAIVNIRNDGDPVSWYGRHIGSIFELPCESNHHSITAIIDGIKKMSAFGGMSDWQYRKQAYIKLMEMCYGGRLNESAKSCLERITSICDHSLSPIDVKESYQDAVEGKLSIPDYNTGIKGVDLAQKDLWILRVLDYATKDMTRIWLGDDLLRAATPDQVDAIVAKMVDSYSASDVIDESTLDDLVEGAVTTELLHRQIGLINQTFANVAINDFAVPIDFEGLKHACAALATCYSYICDMRLGTPTDGEYGEADIKGDSGSSDVAEYLKNAMDRIRVAIDSNAESVCASVTLKINQTVAMTRTAFDGTLTLFNGHSSVPITGVKFEPSVLNENGDECKDLFKLLLGEEEVVGVNGSKLITGADIVAGGSGSTVVRFVPTHEAAPSEAKVYRFGGVVTYTDPFTGQKATVELTPVSLTVEPSPYLKLDYFVQRDVFSDDPDTDKIEPSVPAEIAVLVRNMGAGEAKNVTIDSAQPVMTENEKGLAIDFKLSDFDLEGSCIDGKEAHLGLLSTVNFGTIESGESKIAQWWLTSTLQGHFVDMKATCTPRNKWNTPDTSLVDTEHVDVHKLVRSVSADGDDLPDFLVCDEKDLYGLPDQIITAKGVPLSVRHDGRATISGALAGASPDLLVAVTGSEGWNYVYLPVVGVSGYEVAGVSCDDADLPSRNAWTTDRTFKDAGKPIAEDRLHLLVYFSEAGTKDIVVKLNGTSANGPKVESFEGITAGAMEYEVRDAVTVVFDRAIDPATFSVADLQLIRQGAYINDLSGVAIRAADESNRSFELTGLAAYCSEKGRYELVVQCAGIRSADGLSGSVGKSVSWMLGVSGAADSFVVTREVGVAGNVFTFTFNTPAIKLTKERLKLTKNGAAVALPPTVSIVDKGLGVYEVTGLDKILAEEGAYSLSCDLCGGVAASWSDDLTPPVGAANLRISPDGGIDENDGITYTRELTVTGDLSEDNLSVEVLVSYAGAEPTKLTDAIVKERTFSASVVLPADGNATLVVRSTDAAGNFADATKDVYVDVIPITATFIGAPAEDVVASKIDLVVSEDLCDGDLNERGFTLTCNGYDVLLAWRLDIDYRSELTAEANGVGVSGRRDGCRYSLEGLDSICKEDGIYELRFDSPAVHKRSSGLTQELHASVTWTYKCPDREPPTLGEVLIDGLAVGLSYEWGFRRIEIPFSEPVNVPDLIANGLITIAVRTGFTYLPSWNAAKNVLTLTVFDEKLPRGAGRVILDPALIKDMAGNELVCSQSDDAAGTDSFGGGQQLAKVDGYAMPTWHDGQLTVGYKTSAGEGVAKMGDHVLVSGIAGGGCQGVSVCWADWDGDGTEELFVGHSDGCIEKQAYVPPSDKPYMPTSIHADVIWPVLSAGEKFDSSRAVLCSFDADGDGINESVVCGGSDGKFRRLWKQEDGSVGCEWLVDLQGSPIVIAEGRSAPTFADVNHDGRIDLLTGDTKGNVWLYYGTDRAWISTPVCLIDNSKGKLSDRSRVAYGDVNSDGVGDLIVGRSDGSVVAMLGEARPAAAIEYEIVWPITLGESLDLPTQTWEIGGAAEWTPEWCDEASDGEHCAFIRNVGNNATAWMQTTVDGPGEISFAWMCDLASKNTKLQFFVDDVAQGVVSGSSPWTPVRVTVYGEGAHVLKWRLFTGRSGAAATDVGAVDAVSWKPAVPPTLAEALNADLTWNTSGARQWHGVAKDSRIGARENWAVASGLGDDETAAIETRVYGNGLLVFDWGVSCEEEYDWMEVSVDGEVKTYITGETGWTTEAIDIIGEGWHVVRWEYIKDEMDEPELVGDNTAMLDSVLWYSDDVLPEEPEKTATENTPVPVPFTEIDAKYKSYLDAVNGDYEAAALAIGKNGYAIWECYVAGLDPDDPDSKFRITAIKFEDGELKVTWSPDLKDARKYTEYGRKELGGSEEWTDMKDVAPAEKNIYRFRKVSVDMP